MTRTDIISRTALILLLVAGNVGADEKTAPKPRVGIHAHNDYEHPHPLTDALDQGFCSVEVDVHLIQGRLLVGHDPRDLNPQRTLESLYLDPLKKRITENGGRVYKKGPIFTLMIDVKSDAAATYTAIKAALKPYEKLLVVFRRDKFEPAAIGVIISGNRDQATMEKEEVRYAALDGRMSDLTSDPSPPPELVLMVSGPWNEQFKWNGKGAMDDDELKKLKALVAKAHAQRRGIRFWAIPDNEAVWKVLSDAGVIISTDDLSGVAKFYANRKR